MNALATVYAFAYTFPMKAKSQTEVRKTLAATLDSVVEDHEPCIITRGSGRPAAVLMSLEDFNSMEETVYLLKSPRNAEELIKSIEDIDAGRGIKRELIM